MKRITKISVIGVSALIIITTIVGCNHYRSPENRAQWMLDKVSSELALTQEQQKKLVAVKDELLSSRQLMKSRMSDNHAQLLSLLEQSTLDQDKALAIIQSQTQMINERSPVMVAAFAGFYDSLDSDQQLKISQFFSEHKERHMHHHGPRGFYSEK